MMGVANPHIVSMVTISKSEGNSDRSIGNDNKEEASKEGGAKASKEGGDEEARKEEGKPNLPRAAANK